MSRPENQILVVDKLTYAGNRSSLRDLEADSRFQFSVLDICDTPGLQNVFTSFAPEVVYHLAAESHVDRSIDGPEEFIQTNLVGTFRMLQAARAHLEGLPTLDRERFRFLHVSTDEVYGSLDFSEPGFTEATRYDPHSPYSASKAGSDHLARAWNTTYGLPVIVTNCSNNYGPYQFPEKLVPTVILKALRGDSIPVYGKGENVRDWLYVEDHARALELVADRGTAGATYNIGGNNERRNIDLIQMICALLDDLYPCARNLQLRSKNPSIGRYDQLITFVQDRPAHDLRYAIDSSKIRDELNWKPIEDFRSGFLKTVRWYCDNQLWWQNILNGEYRLDRLGLSAETQ